MTALVVADFRTDDAANAGAPRGRALVDAVRRAGADWGTVNSGPEAAGLRTTVRAAAEAGLGLIVVLDDTKAIAGLEDAFRDLGELSVPLLRDRILVVVTTERAGKRLRADAPWAPSAVDLGAFHGGLLSLLRRAAPNYVRATCAVDDLVLPWDFRPAAGLAAVAGTLRTRGGRLWLDGVATDRVSALRDGPAHGLLVRPATA